MTSSSPTPAGAISRIRVIVDAPLRRSDRGSRIGASLRGRAGPCGGPPCAERGARAEDRQLFRTLIDQRCVVGGDGRHHPEEASEDRLSAPGRDVLYRLTAHGRQRLLELGASLPDDGDATAEIPLRYCVDWTEQAHHVSGAVGRALAAWMLEQAWLERLPRTRALRITPAGRHGLRRRFGLEPADWSGSAGG